MSRAVWHSMSTSAKLKSMQIVGLRPVAHTFKCYSNEMTTDH